MTPNQIQDIKKMLLSERKDIAVELFRQYHKQPPVKTYDRPVASFADLNADEKAELRKGWSKPNIPDIGPYADYIVNIIEQIIRSN